MSPQTSASSSGADWHRSRKSASTSPNRSGGNNAIPPKMTGPTGWRSNSNEVAMPKFAPAPRMAQNRSAFWSGLAVR